MKKKADEYLFNEAIKYLGKYPATKKKISEILEKKLRNKKTYQKVIFPENISSQELIENIIKKLDELKIINERHFIETVFHYYEQSLFSIKKIKNKLYQKGFEQSLIEEYISKQELIGNIIQKLDEMKIINERHFIETVFHYYEQSLFSIKKIKNKLFQKGFEQSLIEEYISKKVSENPDLELDILKRYISRKKLSKLEINDLKKKLYQQSFSENSVYKVTKD